MSFADWSKPVLIYQANGVQGGAVARAALRHGLKVRALVRNPLRSQILEEQGAELVRGDLSDVSSLVAASQGATRAVIQIPIGPAKEMHAHASHAFYAAKIAGITSVILRLSSASREEPCDEPSFVANAMVEDVARQSGILSVIVRPTMYLDNLLKPSARADIVNRGACMLPISASQRIAWTSADDCAEATVRFLMSDSTCTGDYCIAGSESLSGEALARRITAGLGRPVVYRSQPLDEFEREVDQVMGAGTGRRVASKFRYFATHREDTDAILATPYTGLAALGQFSPTSVETWVRNQRPAFFENGGGNEFESIRHM
jgi:uncharacterized protein YbjT (DUF2867 family)